MSAFDLPTPIASDFASADSFRGRLVLIEVTGFEANLPMFQQPGKFADRVTATVTVVDGKGPVQIFAQKAPTGKFLDGPEHKGVWFSQARIVEAVADKGPQHIGRKVLGVIDTFKPGQPAGLGNPWGITNPTPEQIEAATQFLAGQMVAGATSAPAAVPDDPWATK